MLEITPVEVFDDNYIWLLHRPGVKQVAVVDPGDEEPLLELLKREGLELEAILLTHKHGDHTGGAAELVAAYPEVAVFGPANENISVVTKKLHDGESIHIAGLDLYLSIMELPGHTEGHLAYLTDGALFCGDTLFASGCGRVFSGTHEQLYSSLQRIAALPADTLIYCAHEYTLDNIGFAKWVEPDNQAVLQRELVAQEQRARGEPTIPSRLQLELDSNPFMRCSEESVMAAAEGYVGHPLHGGVEIFTAIRNWKDREYD